MAAPLQARTAWHHGSHLPGRLKINKGIKSCFLGLSCPSPSKLDKTLLENWSSITCFDIFSLQKRLLIINSTNSFFSCIINHELSYSLSKDAISWGVSHQLPSPRTLRLQVTSFCTFQSCLWIWFGEIIRHLDSPYHSGQSLSWKNYSGFIWLLKISLDDVSGENNMPSY